MIWIELSLKNFGSHRSKTFTFREGLNAIIGSNGSGKSTLAAAAIFALTGEMIDDSTKDEALSYGQERGYAELTFDHNGNRYVIKRALESAKQCLKLPDGTEITRSAEIQAYLEKMLETSFAAIKTNVFAQQGKIDQVMFMTPTKRLESFQEIFQLTQADTGARALQLEIAKYKITAGLGDQILDLSGQHQHLRDRIVTGRSKSEELGKAADRLRPQKRILAEALEAQRTIAAVRSTATAIAKLEDEIRTQEAVIAQREAGGDLDPSIPLRKPELAELVPVRTRLQEMAFFKQKLREQAQAAANLEACKQRLATIPEVNQEEILTLEAALREIQQQLTLARAPYVVPEALQQAEISAREKVIQTQSLPQTAPAIEALASDLRQLKRDIELAEMGKCPTCGSETAHGPEHLLALKANYQQLQLQIDTQTKKLQEMRTAIIANAQQALQRAADAIAADRQGYAVSRQALIQANTGKQSQLELQRQTLVASVTTRAQILQQQEVLQATLGAAPAFDYSPEAEANLQAREKQLVELEAVIADYERKLKDIAYHRQSAATRLQEMKAAQAQQNADIQLPSAEVIASAQKDCEALQQVEQELEVLGRGIAQDEVQAQAVLAQLNRLRDQSAKEERDRKWVEICQKARGLLHVSGYPALAMREYSEVINARIQYYLHLWDAPFTMRLDQDMQFQVEFNDGSRKHPARRLSGGQRVVAATSFRFAMADTFARGVGLLVLDEPTVFLDAEAIDQFAKLLLQLKELSRAHGRQIVLITHEAKLAGMFDHVVQVGDAK